LRLPLAMRVSTVLIETARVAATAARLSSGRIVGVGRLGMAQAYSQYAYQSGALENFPMPGLSVIETQTYPHFFDLPVCLFPIDAALLFHSLQFHGLSENLIKRRCSCLQFSLQTCDDV
jgi:hypothetical protein